MKMKKAVTIILLMIMTLLQFSFVSANTTRTMDVTLRSAHGVDLNHLETGVTFHIAIHLDNLQNIEKGVRYIQAQLEYNKGILEFGGITQDQSQNNWTMDPDKDFNKENGKFIVETNSPVTTAGNTFELAFRVKPSVTEDVTTSIKLKGIEASGGDGLILANNDATIEVSVVVPEEPDLTEKITSTKYDIDNGMIAKIVPGTTVREFKNNVTTENVDKDAIIFKNQAGNTLNADDVIGTGMQIKVGETLQFTASVVGDVDGDTQITVNDLAKVKLHIIKDTPLIGAYLKAADVDEIMENGETVGANDMARIKIVLIKLNGIDNFDDNFENV